MNRIMVRALNAHTEMSNDLSQLAERYRSELRVIDELEREYREQMMQERDQVMDKIEQLQQAIREHEARHPDPEPLKMALNA